MAKIFILIGVLFIAVGTLLYFVPNAFSWFGKLPGDISTAGDQTKVFIPITSMIVISVVLSLLLTLFNRF